MQRWTFWSRWFVENYILGSGVHWGMLLRWANSFCLPQKAITPTVAMARTRSTEEDTKPVSSSSRECSQKAYPPAAFSPWDPSRFVLLPGLWEGIPHSCKACENNKALCHTRLCSFSTVSLTCKPKGCAGEAGADAVHKSKPSQSISDASSLIPLLQEHLGCKGGLSLVKPVLPRGTTTRTPPKNLEFSRRLKLLAFMIRWLRARIWKLRVELPLCVVHAETLGYFTEKCWL